MTVDYLIVGQGICGTLLSLNLIKQGKTVLVIDDAQAFTSSKIASGVINPVTGRRIVKTWMIDELLPFAWNTYKQLGEELSVDLIQQCNVLDFHPTPQMQEAFLSRYQTDQQYLTIADEVYWKPYFNFNYGIGEVDPCLLIDLNSMLDAWRKILQQQNALLEERFSESQLSITAGGITYQNISAQKIIYCSGTDTFNSSYFKLLPYANNKGEVIIAEIPGLPRTNIYKQGISIVPWKDNLFWIGSTYEWEYSHLQPTDRFRQKTEDQLNFWLKLPYKILDHFAAERPATIERRPFIGTHPHHPAICIFNGMGTKGCSLAPYFAPQLTQHLISNAPITPEADVQRFKRILSHHLS
jgi:glycine/D-amino acid oxidase-like deaminating enzyme